MEEQGTALEREKQIKMLLLGCRRLLGATADTGAPSKPYRGLFSEPV